MKKLTIFVMCIGLSSCASTVNKQNTRDLANSRNISEYKMLEDTSLSCTVNRIKKLVSFNVDNYPVFTVESERKNDFRRNVAYCQNFLFVFKKFGGDILRIDRSAFGHGTQLFTNNLNQIPVDLNSDSTIECSSVWKTGTVSLKINGEIVFSNVGHNGSGPLSYTDEKKACETVKKWGQDKRRFNIEYFNGSFHKIVTWNR